MHSTWRFGAFCLVLTVSCLWPQPTVATLQANTNPSVKEFGTADSALVQCFDKTIYAFSHSPSSVVHITDKNINYVKVETLNTAYHGGVNAEITGGAIKKPNIVITLTEGSNKPIFKSNVRVTMFCEA
ncbi:uncharacterized protein LOC128727025 [Anopheles nili]|uniref:uncharacterized protein LOC128727025 n=1 Tax=Anopheles nili TaxID=185578 RepID=UPI00237B6893|nr:uncharacterized protein LOC128727025 [Anopheles nili]